ncbi:MAG: hypothetical protein JWM11_3903 [Planctomycetaceae bacterium]|nr:hypothetical protein [Planctomycetaceae bacterium]
MLGLMSSSWRAWMSAVLLFLGLFVFTGCGRQGFQRAAVAEEKVGQGFTNRLAKETSPYLLLHAHNPVDWYPWGPEAFEKAKREKKLIFLSIGYSSCYWCHVMERLVFTNPEIAKYMNAHFVNIKVDREERPDVDEIYMVALQIYFQAIGSSQTGGWPLSIFLTPNLKPLGGGTYFPPEDSEGRDGFRSILKRIQELWVADAEKLQKTGDALAGAVKDASRVRPNLVPVKLEASLVQRAVDELKATYDADNGGFDFNPLQPTRPKFPVPVKLNLLQSYLESHPKDTAAEMLYQTLDKLAAGGIHDQLGGGFHRYSTDRFWRVPHFEKMLYDNAQLADVYVAAYKATNNQKYRTVAEDIITFVLRDLCDSHGGFFSALDAETNGVEGQYYVWTRDEVKQVLTPDEVRLCAQCFGMDREPNFEKAYVLEVIRPAAKLAEDFQLKPGVVDERLQAIKAKLLAARGKRQPLLRDDKVLTSWNGLMIRALAHAARDLNRPEYLRAAEKAATFILSKMRDDKGRLLRTYRAQVAKVPAYLDDYAFLIEGLLALHEASQDEKWLNAAVRLADQQRELFWDQQQQGFYFMATDHEELLARTKTMHDSVLPSGNSVAARNLIRLAELTKKPAYLRDAEETLLACAPILKESPRGAVNLAVAITEFLAVKPKAGAARGRPNQDQIADAGTPDVDSELEVDPDRALELDTDVNGPFGSKVQLVGNQTTEEKGAAPKKKKEPEQVTGVAFLSVDRLPAGDACEFVVVLKIDDGWHINPNPAGDEFAIPTELTMKSKFKVKAEEISYPEPEEHDVPGLKKKLQYYSKQVEIRGVLDVPKSASGQEEVLEFLVKYQACNEKKCLRPMTLSIKVPVKVAAAGESVKSANKKWFAPPAAE